MPRSSRLALYAPVCDAQYAVAVRAGTVGAYRTVSARRPPSRWHHGHPGGQEGRTLIPAGWFDMWSDATFATDPAGGGNTPASAHPTAWSKTRIWSTGRSPYDPANISAPMMLVLAEWDQDTPLYMAQEVFAKMTNSPDKRFVILGEGTHAIALEKNRMRLIREVQQFLEE